MTDVRHGREDRRQVRRGGRRDSDRLVLSPELQREADEYASEIQHSLEALTEALKASDYKTAKESSDRIKHSAEALRLLLVSGMSMRQSSPSGEPPSR